jgi:transposase InsO family protein
MRYPASEKLEIIRLVEQSHLPVKQTVDKLGIPRTTFYRWYDRYQIGGPEALEDQSPHPFKIWNRIPDDYSRYIIAWKLCTTMKTSDVTNTLERALQASGCDQAHIAHKPRLLSDNGSSYVSGELAE